MSLYARRICILILILILILAPVQLRAERLCSAGHENPDQAMFCMFCARELAPPEVAEPADQKQTVEEVSPQSIPPVTVPAYDSLYTEDQPVVKDPPVSIPEGFIDLLSEDLDQKPPDNVAQDGIFTRWFGSDPRGFNYVTEAGADVQDNIYAYVAESLARRHYENPDRWAPQLATRILVNADRTEYRIELRRGVKWHQPRVDFSNPRYRWLAAPRELTARDVKFFIDIVLNPSVDTAGLGSYYQDISECRVVDDHHLVIRWSRSLYHSVSSVLSIVPLPGFIYGADEDGRPYPAAEIGTQFNGHWFNRNAIGCGPYYFRDYTPGMQIVLERNEEYWGVKPPIKTLKFLIYRDPQQNVQKLKAMEQDFSVLTPAQYRDEVLNSRAVSPVTGEPLQVGVYQGLVYYYIGWNLRRPPFNEAAVREAMTCALNRKELLENVFYNLGEVTCSPVFKHSPEYNSRLIPRAFNTGRSAQLLDDADWVDRDGNGIREKYIGVEKYELSFNLLIYADSVEWRAVAAVLREDLRKIGVRMTVQPVDWADMQQRMDSRDFDAFTGGWGLTWESDPFQVWHSSQADVLGGSNVIGFQNQEADQLMEKLRVTFEAKQRKKLLDRFQEILYNEQPYTFVFCRKYVALWWDHLKNVSFQRLSPHELSLPWFIQPH